MDPGVEQQAALELAARRRPLEPRDRLAGVAELELLAAQQRLECRPLDRRLDAGGETALDLAPAPLAVERVVAVAHPAADLGELGREAVGRRRLARRRQAAQKRQRQDRSGDRRSDPPPTAAARSAHPPPEPTTAGDAATPPRGWPSPFGGAGRLIACAAAMDAPAGGLSDLHRHLDGSLRMETLRELAAAAGVEVPDDLRFRPGMGLAAALERFRVTLAVLESEAAVARVAAEICEDAAGEGVTTLEVRFAPQLHGGAGKGAAGMARTVDAALDGLGGRAGLILCALYGEPPELVAKLVEIAAPRPGVVAIDLAGSPRPEHRWRLADYAGPFAEARRRGIGRTVHAGEGRPASEIGEAVATLGAQRIGHGTTLVDDPAALELVLERGVVIEACPTSNLHTGAIAALDEHPLPRWLELGVRATINTDNTLLSAVDAPGEYARAARLPGMTPAAVAACAATGHAAAFRRG